MAYKYSQQIVLTTPRLHFVVNATERGELLGQTSRLYVQTKSTFAIEGEKGQLSFQKMQDKTYGFQVNQHILQSIL